MTIFKTRPSKQGRYPIFSDKQFKDSEIRIFDA